MVLDILPLKNSVQSLESALEKYKKHQWDEIRDGCIQRFEYTYELSFKMIKRYLREKFANPSEIDQLSFNQVIRKAYADKLISKEISVWRTYKEQRNKTSHGYDQKIAKDVFQTIPHFLIEAKYLLKKLEKKVKSIG